MPQVKIADHYRQTIKREYSDWRLAWAREAGQNSLDAGATRINVTVEQDAPGKVRVTWADNGCGMTREVLENKFMAIGGTQKNNGATGGFGIAKSILAFAHDSYLIKTGNMRVHGTGFEYHIENSSQSGAGCILSTVMDGPDADIEDAIKYWVNLTTTSCEIYLNGAKLETLKFHKKARLKTDWASIYIPKAIQHNRHGIHVRINGQFMFKTWSSIKQAVIVEIEGTNSQNYFTGNRDGMQGHYEWRLRDLVEKLLENKRALKSEDEKITIYRGYKSHIALGNKNESSTIKIGSKPISDELNRIAALANSEIERQVIEAIGGESQVHQDNRHSGFDWDIVVRNVTNKEIGSRWLPGTMSKHATQLLIRWAKILSICGYILGINQEVRIGWNFELDARAIYRKDDEHGAMILLNPVEKSGNRLNQYWRNDRASFWELVSTAIHELTHIGIPSHNEAYAAALTHNTAKVMAQISLLETLFKETK